jgi:hypothetical protein
MNRLVIVAICGALVACGGYSPQYGEDPTYVVTHDSGVHIGTDIADASHSDVVEASSTLSGDDASDAQVDAGSEEDLAEASVTDSSSSDVSEASVPTDAGEEDSSSSASEGCHHHTKW